MKLAHKLKDFTHHAHPLLPGYIALVVTAEIVLLIWWHGGW